MSLNHQPVWCGCLLGPDLGRESTKIKVIRQHIALPHSTHPPGAGRLLSVGSRGAPHRRSAKSGVLPDPSASWKLCGTRACSEAAGRQRCLGLCRELYGGPPTLDASGCRVACMRRSSREHAALSFPTVHAASETIHTVCGVSMDAPDVAARLIARFLG